MPILGIETKYQQRNNKKLYTNVPAKEDYIGNNPSENIDVQNAIGRKRLTVISTDHNQNKENDGNHRNQKTTGVSIHGHNNAVEKGIGNHGQD